MRRLLLAAAAAVAAAAGASAAPAAAAPAYGIQGIGATAGVSFTADLAVAQRLKTTVTRIEASWAALEPDGPGRAPAPEALARLDALIDGAARRRIKTVLFINRTPCWASSAPARLRAGCRGVGRNAFAVTRYQPRDVGRVVPISRFLVERYGSKLAAFEVWNEPDQANEKYWAGPNKVRNYVKLVKALYAPLKRANPALPVLAGSFVGIDSRWLEAMYARGVKGHYDGLAVHFYNLPLLALAGTRATQLANGDEKPMWLTEFGWSSCHRRGGPARELGHACVTQATQAQNLVDVLRSVEDLPYLKAAIQFQVADSPGGFQFGLVDDRRRIKPLYRAALRLQAGGRPEVTRPTIRLTRVGNRLVASGTASQTDALDLRVLQGETPRFLASVVTDRLRRWSVALPAQLGTEGLSVTVRGRLVGGSATARR